MSKGFGIVGLGLAMAVSGSSVAGQSDEELWWDEEGLSYFHTAVSDYYDAPLDGPPPPSYLHPDELPVVYLLAREARVSPEVVMALREQGWSWMDITHHLGVDPYVYVARLPRRSGYWGWHGVRDYRYLTDRHIIDYVNLVFWADYYRRPVTQVIVIRQRVPTWFYYVRYHAPPRVVFVRNPTRWVHVPVWHPKGSGRRAEPVRRAQPRTGTPTAQVPRTPTRPAARSSPTGPLRPGQPTARTAERATSQPNRHVAQPTRPAPGSRPVTQPTRPAQANRPAAQPTRPPQASRPAAQPTRPAQASRPAAQPTRPAQASRPAAQSSRPTRPARPSAQRPSGAGSQSASSSRRGGSTSNRPATTRRPQRPGG